MDTLTTAEVQQRLRTSRATLLRWRRKGMGPRAVKMGKEVRYPVEDFEAWFAGLTDDVGQAAGNSGQHTVSPAPDPGMGEPGSRERLDGSAAYDQQAS